MTFEEIYKIIDPISGWMGNADCRVLYKYASNVSGLIVEIGCHMGRSTKMLALSSPKSKIVTIDSFSFGDIKRIKKAFREATKDLDIKFIRGRSEEVGKIWSEPIDLLFIDGGHSYDQVRKDIELFVPYVKPGSFVLFHDYIADKYKENYRVWEAVNSLREKYFSLVEVESGIGCCKKI